ncbi:hect e3 ubiquitin, partial [Nannochloropsis oceanica]
MATFPGNSWEQALKAAGDVEQQGREGGSEGGVAGGRDGGREARDAALREVLRHFGAWEFEEKADLQQHWQPVLEILHDSLADTLASCPKLLLVPSPSSSPSSSSSFKRKKEMRARLAVLEAEVLAMKNGEPLPLPANYAQALEALCTLVHTLGGGNHMPPSSTGGSSQDTARLAGLLQMQPELIHEMVEVARQPPTGSDRVHLEASLLALNTLAALAGSRIGSRHVNVLAQLGVARGQYTGLLPSLFRYGEGEGGRA